MKMGAVLNEGGHIVALSRNDIDKAAARIKDTTTINKAFEKNIYIKGYTKSMKDRLELLWDDFFALSHDAQERRITAAKDEYGARRKQQRNDAAAAASTSQPPSKLRPKKPRSQWKMQTQVATNEIVSAGGVKIPTTGTALVPDICVLGLITKYDPEAACTYEIK